VNYSLCSKTIIVLDQRKPGKTKKGKENSIPLKITRWTAKKLKKVENDMDGRTKIKGILLETNKYIRALQWEKENIKSSWKATIECYISIYVLSFS